MVGCCSAEKSQLVSSGVQSPSDFGDPTPLGSEASFAHDTRTVLFKVMGMDCAGCARDVESIVTSISGITTYKMNFTVGQVSVTYDPIVTSEEILKNYLERGGYASHMIEDTPYNLLDSLARKSDIAKSRAKFLDSLIFSIPLFVVSDVAKPYFPNSILNERLINGLYLGDLASIFLSIPLLFLVRPFYLSTWKALCRGTSSVDTLITLGVSTTFIYSTCAVATATFSSSINRPETYFGTTGELVSFVLLGRWLESKCTSCAATSLTDLINLLPSTAIRLDCDRQREVAVGDLKIGDIVITKPGSSFAADAIVISGESETDDSMLTGDHSPVVKTIDCSVSAGTVNLNEELLTKVIQVGDRTQLSRIISLIKDAQGDRAQLQVFVDRVTWYFVPVILFLSVCTFIVWISLDPTSYIQKLRLPIIEGTRIGLSLKLATAVILVSCPCALSVATPAAVMCGTGVGLKHGLLIKGAAIFEGMAQVTDIIFDKTGTLTIGKMQVFHTQFSESWTSEDRKRQLWHMIAIAEDGLAEVHPISQALVAHARTYLNQTKDEQMTLMKMESVPGRGIKAILLSKVPGTGPMELLIGKGSFLEECQTALPPNHELAINSSDSHGQTQIYVAVNGQLAGTMLLSDKIKADVFATVQQLSREGKTVWMLTGDNRRSAEAVARAVSIPLTQVLSDCSVQGKAAFIKTLQKNGKKIAMVGDGVNDGLALATANVGISLCGSTEVAMQTADIVLLRPDKLENLITSLKLSEDVFKRVKLNLTFAFLWNIVGIASAMGLLMPLGIYLSPSIAGFAMSMSCTCILLNSLRLKNWQRVKANDTEQDQSSQV